MRWIIRNWLHQAAKEKVTETIKRQAAGPASRQSDESSPHAHIGLVFALNAEVGGFLDQLSGVVSTRGAGFTAHEGGLSGRRVVCIVSGVGRDRAARATKALIDGHRPQWLISAGFAGGLDASVPRGHLVMATSLSDIGGERLTLDVTFDPSSLESFPSLHVGSLLTVDRVVRTPEDKRSLGDQYQALAVDMESFAVADVCRQKKVRFLAIRVISDAIDDTLPDDIENLLQQETLASRAGAVTGAIFRRPSSVKDLWKMKENALTSSDRMGKFLAGIIDQLG